ncbi:hypothetical protein VT1337_05769 [Vibrio tubiashii NCIMB 1337 = ATCC 19106]|nr:hypothetical protein VT1337_05769 [Vibrio tubiashii NCIMB 1337 = ATCC 19106]
MSAIGWALCGIAVDLMENGHLNDKVNISLFFTFVEKTFAFYCDIQRTHRKKAALISRSGSQCPAPLWMQQSIDISHLRFLTDAFARPKSQTWRMY